MLMLEYFCKQKIKIMGKENGKVDKHKVKSRLPGTSITKRPCHRSIARRIYRVEVNGTSVSVYYAHQSINIPVHSSVSGLRFMKSTYLAYLPLFNE